METREKKRSHIPPKNKIGFLEIQSAAQLIPIILFCFLTAFVIDTYNWREPVAREDKTTTLVHASEASHSFDAKVEKDVEHEQQAQSEVIPASRKASAPSIIEKEKKRLVQPVKKVSYEENLEVKESSAQISLKSTEHILETTSVLAPEKINAYEPVATLSTREIPSLEVKKIIKTELFRLQENKFPTRREEKEVILEKVVTNSKASTASVVPKNNYQSADFSWALNDYNQGLQKSVKFTDTPDGKAAYCRTHSGILLKIKNLSDLNTGYGVFVEKSEDGKEFNSIGIINVENKTTPYYFDAQASFNGQHHYRFRSTDKNGETISFGQVSVALSNTLNPLEFSIDSKGVFTLNLGSTKAQTVQYELKEVWGNLNVSSDIIKVVEGENEFHSSLAGEAGLYFLSLKTEQETLELLLEKPGIVADLSFSTPRVSGQQSLVQQIDFSDLVGEKNTLNFDFYLKDGNSLIFNQGIYKSEIVKIKNAKIENLPATLRGRHSESSLWFTAASNISYLHQKVPVILEYKTEEIPAQINIYAAKNAIRPISHFSPDGDGTQDIWRIPGIESCPNTQLLVFNDWGNLVYKTTNVTDKNIWDGRKDGKDLPAGIYYYILGNYGGWVQLER